MKQKTARLQSLDVMRGLTVAMMILVNNGYGESFTQLRHSQWNGMTLCDLVFPFFLFMMGVSTFLSLKKCNFTATPDILRKIFRRTIVLFVIGLAIHWFDHAISGDWLCFGHLRVWGVMQRIALCYLAVSLMALYIPHRLFIPVAIILLAGYSVILLLGHGYAYDATTNILAQADLSIFGYDHLYHKSPVDPEGLISTLPSIAHTMIGFLVGKGLTTSGRPTPPALRWTAIGTSLLAVGLLLAFWLPLNKRIWSPTYVLVTCGLAVLLLVVLMRFIDTPTKNSDSSPSKSPVTTFFLIFGCNPLFLYVCSEVLAIFFGHIGLSSAFYQNVVHALISPEKWASLAYATSFMLLHAFIGWLLYRKRIFIKI